MENDKLSSVFKYVAYVIEILLIFLLSSTPGLIPEMFGGKPTFLILVAISISVFEKEIPSMIFGLICGMLIDISYSASIGTFTLLLTIICFLLGYIVNNIIVANIFNFLLTSLIVCTFLFCVHFLFSYVFKEYGNNGYYFVHHYISRILYTFIFTPVFYFLNRFIYASLSEEK